MLAVKWNETEWIEESGKTGLETVSAFADFMETPAGRNVVLCFEDDGIPFNPLKAPKPDVTEPMEMRGIGGLGIYLVKQRMDKVCYEHVDGKNCLRIEKLDN